MRAIILAAGPGIRLRSLTKKIPKCLLEFSGKTLLERLIQTFRNCGIDDIVVIRGYHGESINFPSIDYITNKRFDKTGITESLFCAKEKLVDSVIISYADIIFEEGVLMKLIESKDEISRIVDKNWKEYWEIRSDDPLSDAESLVLDKDNYILNIGEKNLKKIDEIDGQFIGLIKFQNDGIIVLKKFYEKVKLSSKNGYNPLNPSLPFEQSTLTNLLHGLIKSGQKIKAIPIKNRWLEFDTINDFEIYNNMLQDNSISKFISLK